MADEHQKHSTVATNLYALIRHEDPRPKPSVNAWATKYGVVQTTINRVLTGKDLTTGQLEKIVEALNAKGWALQAWQLLVPGFEPSNPPVLMEASPAERRLYARFKNSIREAAATIYQDGGAPDHQWAPGQTPRRRATDR